MPPPIHLTMHLQHSRSLQSVGSGSGKLAGGAATAAAAAAAIAADDGSNCEQDEEEWRAVLEGGTWPFQRLCDQVRERCLLLLATGYG